MKLPTIILVTFLWITSARGGSSDYSSYFGGTDHEDYIEWYETSAIGRSSASMFLSDASDASDSTYYGAAIHWSIIDNYQLRLAIAVRATGWLGFGLSENGGMRGADLMLFETAQPDRVRDAHVLDEFMPITDCKQDWELQAWHVTEQFLMVQVTRALDTGDGQDRPIVTAAGVPPTRIIVAWGNTPQAKYHGPNHRLRGAIQWTQEEDVLDFATRMQQDAAQTFRVAATNYTIPAQETEYADFCLNSTDMLGQGVPEDQPISIIGVEPLIDQLAHVHHLTIYGFPDASCESLERTMVYVWGPGEEATAFPDDVALYAGPGHSTSFLMEVHYDNVHLVPDIQDSTAVQFYYTTEMRPIEASVLQLGDPFVQLSGTAVGAGDHIFSCPSSCTSTILTEPVTILREYLHMHAHGAQARNEVLRGDDEVVHLAQIDFFDFHQQGNQAVQQDAYQVQPGDSFRTTCRYQSVRQDDGGKVHFGLSSREEMCIVFILYYPRQTFSGLPWTCAYNIPFEFCASTWEAPTTTETTMPRLFGTTNTTECSVATPSTSSVVTNATESIVPTLMQEPSESSNARGSANVHLFVWMNSMVVAIIFMGMV